MNDPHPQAEDRVDDPAAMSTEAEPTVEPPAGQRRADAAEITRLEQRHQELVAKLRAAKTAQQQAEERLALLESRLSRQEDRLSQAHAELELRKQEVRYRLGDALVRACYRPADFLRLPGRVVKLLYEGIRRNRDRRNAEKGEAALLREPGSQVAVTAARGTSAPRSPQQTDTDQPKSAITFAPAVRLNRAPRLPLKVGAIMDEFTYECFRDECNLIRFTPENWKQLFAAQRPDFFFAESCWGGNGGVWKLHDPDSPALRELAAWCRQREIPTVFWNKEDPPHFDRFIASASRFDYIFTTDEECIARYRGRVGHDRVYALPFAVQPAIHNPVNSKRERIGNLCYAGTYYREQYPQRRRDTDLLLRPAKSRGLQIFDRRHGYGESDRYRFPPEYQPFIRGGLSYADMIAAYKAYRVFLNVNSVRHSPTMLSRRVLEILACGTAVISTPALAFERLLGRDAVGIADSEEQAGEWMDRLLGDPELRERMVIRGQRRIFNEHTYERRLHQILDILGLPHSVPLRRVSVVTVTSRPALLDNVIANYRRQVYHDKELIVVLSGDSFNPAEVREKLASVPGARLLARPESSPPGACLNSAIDQSQHEFVAKFDDDAFYGPHYLTDMIHAFLYSGTQIVGKRAHFDYLPDRRCLTLQFPQSEHEYVPLVRGATLVVRRGLFEEQPFPEDVQRDAASAFQQACVDRGLDIYSADRFNFVAGCAAPPDGRAEQISDDEFLKDSRIVAHGDDYREQVSV